MKSSLNHPINGSSIPSDPQLTMESPERSRSVGKENSCPICLADFCDPALLNCCSHVFCYDCIFQWMMMKDECPLCKRLLRKIKHNLIGCSSIEKPTWEKKGTIEDVLKLRSDSEMNQILEQTSYPPESERKSVLEVIKSLNEEIYRLNNLSWASYFREELYQKSIKGVDQELNEYKQLLEDFDSLPRSNLFRQPSFRRVIYHRNLMPRSICPPRYSIPFASDYVRNNTVHVRELIFPYLIREISAITNKSSITIDDYMNALIDYFSKRISRLEIVTFLSKRGIRNPHQFINNLSHFASSGQSLEVYDQNSEYIPRAVNYFANADQPDDEEDVLVIHSSTNNDIQVLGEYAGAAPPGHEQTQNGSDTGNLQQRFPWENNSQDGPAAPRTHGLYQPSFPSSDSSSRSGGRHTNFSSLLDEISRFRDFLRYTTDRAQLGETSSSNSAAASCFIPSRSTLLRPSSNNVQSSSSNPNPGNRSSPLPSSSSSLFLPSLRQHGIINASQNGRQGPISSSSFFPQNQRTHNNNNDRYSGFFSDDTRALSPTSSSPPPPPTTTAIHPLPIISLTSNNVESENGDPSRRYRLFVEGRTTMPSSTTTFPSVSAGSGYHPPPPPLPPTSNNGPGEWLPILSSQPSGATPTTVSSITSADVCHPLSTSAAISPDSRDAPPPPMVPMGAMEVLNDADDDDIQVCRHFSSSPDILFSASLMPARTDSIQSLLVEDEQRPKKADDDTDDSSIELVAHCSNHRQQRQQHQQQNNRFFSATSIGRGIFGPKRPVFDRSPSPRAKQRRAHNNDNCSG